MNHKICKGSCYAATFNDFGLCKCQHCGGLSDNEMAIEVWKCNGFTESEIKKKLHDQNIARGES